ncbi:MAG: hypothetical protein IPO21_14635 [Bacteroidales bacterium]|nr:hypothetical protein [Bacteroidales bacterium]
MGTPSMKLAIFDAAGNKVAETNAANPGVAGLFQKDLVSPYTLESAKMYYFAVTDVNNTTTTILVNGQSANPFNLSDNTSKLVNPTMGTPGISVNCIWIAVH